MFNWVIKKIMLFLGNPAPAARDFDFKDAKTVLIRPWAKGIGDSIVLTGAIRELKKKYPHITIYMMQRKRSRAIFAGNPYIDKVYPPSFFHYLKLRNKIDVYIDLKDSVNIRQFIALRLLNPKKVTGTRRAYKHGLKNSDFSYYKDFVTEVKHPAGVFAHDAVFNESFYAFDLKPGEKKYDLSYREEDLKIANNFWKKDKKRVILNIYATNKILDIQKVVTVMNNIQKDFTDLDIVIPFAAKNKKDAAALCYTAGGGGILNARLSYKTTTRELLALVKSCDAVISVDTGIPHIACAFDKSTVVFFEEGMLSWRPIHKNHTIVLCTVTEVVNKIRHYTFDTKEAGEAIKKQLGNI